MITADSGLDWLRTLTRSVVSEPAKSPFIQTTTGASFDIRMKEPLPYELDGSERGTTRHLKTKVKPRAITICVPEDGGDMSTANEVPETWGLTGDDATETLARVGRGALMRDAFLRLRWSDGFSHARSMAYATTLSSSKASSPWSAWPVCWARAARAI